MEESWTGSSSSPRRVPGPTLSATSSFEALALETGTHDPKLNQLAKNCFQKTGEYITHELNSNLDDYKLLENMNQTAIAHFEEMEDIITNLEKSNADLKTKYEDLRPKLQQIDEIEKTVDKMELAAYQLDAYSLKLEAKYKNLNIKSK